MSVTVYKSDQLNLPEHIARKLKGRKIEFIETNDGILIKPVEDPIKELRGFLEGSKFTTEAYLQQKRRDREIEQ
ncbi:MAG: AbrB/MazE/SpoVT family DNA-binding domain-containing protein [Bacillota bacterium]